MKLRTKLLLPTLLGFILFALVLHFYWAPSQQQKLLDSFIYQQELLLISIEPELLRSLSAQDYAALNAFLDKQVDIHNEHWSFIKLNLNNGDRVYPIFDEENQATGENILLLTREIDEDEDPLATISVYLDKSLETQQIDESIWQIEKILLLILALIIVLSTFIQNRTIISPLLMLQRAVKKLQQGDYNANISIKRNDEIGDLLHNFDQMRQERKLIEDSLRISATAFDTLEGLVVTDKLRKTLKVNKSFTEITGFDEKDVINNPPETAMVYASTNEEYKDIWAHVAEHGHWTQEVWSMTKDGKRYPVWFSIKSIVDKNNVVTNYLIHFLDISARKQQELEIEQKTNELKEAINKAELALKVKSEFLATMSHEIRTPLNGVIGMLNLLMESELNDEQLSYSELATESANSLRTVIDDILDFSKIEAGKMSIEKVEFDLYTFFDKFIQTTSFTVQDKPIELILDMSSCDNDLIISDPVRIQQILNNLVSNAIKFTSDGEVVVTVTTLPSSTENKKRLICTVADSGIGIPQDKLEKLFKPFSQVDSSTTRNYGGTGLGLVISQRICSMMNGEISVESKIDKGSTFTFYIEVEMSKNSASKANQAPAYNQSILLYDTNKVSEQAFSNQLTHWGAKVTIAKTIDDVLEHIQNDQAYDKIIVDISKLPSWGKKQVSELRQFETSKATPIVLIYPNPLEKSKANWTLFDAIITLSKPLSPLDINILCSNNKQEQEQLNNKDFSSHKDSNAEEKDAHNKIVKANLKILLVEDNEVNQLVAKGILQKFGVTIEVAENGLVALQAITKSKETTPFDLIFMDCQMPVMDGYQATSWIRKIEQTGQYKDLPIIAMTANSMEGDKEKCLAAGMSDYISKPVDPNKVKHVIEHWVTNPSANKNLDDAVPNVVKQLGGPRNNNQQHKQNVWNKSDLMKVSCDNETTAVKLAESFLSTTPEPIEALRNALLNGDIQTVSSVSHSIKGSSANVGGSQLFNTMGELGEAAHKKDVQNFQSYAEQVQVQFELLANELQAFIKELE